MSSRLSYLLFSIIVLIILVPVITGPISWYDEGIILTGAERLTHGESIYTDFWALYPPGQFFVIAKLLSFFGKKIMVTRIYDALIKLGICLVAFHLLKHIVNIGLRFFVGIVFALTVAYDTYSLYPVFAALLGSILILYLMLQSPNRESFSQHYKIAFLIFLTSYMRIDIAAYIGVTYVFYFFISFYKNHFWQHALHALFALTMFGGLTLCLIYFNYGFNTYYTNVIQAPSIYSTHFRYTSYPIDFSFSSTTLKFTLVPLLLIVSLLSAAYLFYVKKIATYKSILIISMFACLLLLQISFRKDNVHLMPSAIFSILLSGLWIPHVIYLKTYRWFFISTFTLYAILFLFSPLRVRCNELLHGRGLVYNHNIACAQGLGLEPDFIDAINEVKAISSPHDYLYVGIKNHDLFILNSVIFYFVCDRKYATKYHELHPGVADTKATQTYIVNELILHQPKALVLEDNYWYEPNPTQIDEHFDIVDNYITKHYVFDKAFHGIKIYKLAVLETKH